MATFQSKFIQGIAEARELVDNIEEQGGLAWITDDYGSNMSGQREWMGYSVQSFSPEQVREAAARRATA